MFKNHLKIAFRSLRKRALFSSINTIGLSIAIASSILLFLTSFHELSYDKFHEDSDRIYRVFHHDYTPDGIQKGSGWPTPFQPALKEEFGDQLYAARWKNNQAAIEYEGKLFEANFKMTDEDFFEIFTFPILKGDPTTPLKDLGSIVLAENLVGKLFPNEDPIGKTVTMSYDNIKKDFIVSAVIADFPNNSTLTFTALARFENDADYAQTKDMWSAFHHNVYVKIKSKIKKEVLESAMLPFANEKFTDEEEEEGEQPVYADADGNTFIPKLQPITDLHLNSALNESTGMNLKTVFPYALLLIGMFILMIASINFVNLTLGSSVNRAMEVGLRKVLGANRMQLISQFWWEALIVIGIALGLGITLAQLAMPTFNNFFNEELSLANASIIWILALILLMVAFIGGAYPALVLSKFQPATVLKKLTNFQKPGKLRNFLVVFQFAISILLITCTIVIYQQLSFVQNKSLGFNKEEVMSIPVGNEIEGRKAIQRMRNEFSGDAHILSITGNDGNLGMGKDLSTSRTGWGFSYKGEPVFTMFQSIDYDFIKTLDLELIAGRTFDPNRPTDTIDKMIINETFAKSLNIDLNDPSTMKLDTSASFEVLGIIKDYHFDGLKEEINPLSLAIDKKYGIEYILVRMAPQNMTQSVNRLKALWKEIAPRTEFAGSFLDENTERLYRDEQRLSTILLIAGSLAIFLSCLGLFAIALLTIVQRTKEIGIRKVLGASVPNIVKLLSTDFLKLILFSTIIAVPLSWYSMNQWLQDFYYRIEFPWWVLFVAGILVAFIALTTISFHSVRAALANPINSLKDE